MILMQNFEGYLIKRGYSITTPSGKHSTVYDYQKRIETIRKRENIRSLDELAQNIDQCVIKYSECGSEREFGAKSHNAYINSVRRFQEFVKQY